MFSSSSSPSSSSKEIEIEQKFVLSDGAIIETRLKELGLDKKDETTMIVDWYYDTPDLRLTPQDCWLRYRETAKKSCWQLKKGRRKQQQHDEGGTTVYDEIEGDDAIKEALSMIPTEIAGAAELPAAELPADRMGSKEATRTLDGHAVPKLPVECPLEGFARIETSRTSWSLPDQSICVDLDQAGHGYTVGEVETVVQSESEIDTGRRLVQKFLKELLPEDNNGDSKPVVGKLEDYLMRFRPEHYEACIKGGSIQR